MSRVRKELAEELFKFSRLIRGRSFDPSSEVASILGEAAALLNAAPDGDGLANLTDRLREPVDFAGCDPLMIEAADEIERLRLELASPKTDPELTPDQKRWREHEAILDQKIRYPNAPKTDPEPGKMDVEIDPADVWEEYCAEVPADDRSPQGAMAFALRGGAQE